MQIYYDGSAVDRLICITAIFGYLHLMQSNVNELRQIGGQTINLQNSANMKIDN